MYYLSRKIKAYATAFGIFSLIIIVAPLGMITSPINYVDINTAKFAYGQGSEISSNSNTNKTNTSLIDVQNIQARKVHVQIQMV